MIDRSPTADVQRGCLIGDSVVATVHIGFAIMHILYSGSSILGFSDFPVMLCSLQRLA